MGKALAIETHYTDIEKMVLPFMTASQKLRPYFQAHTIRVQMFQRPDSSRRLIKWAVELSKFDIVFKMKIVVKGQVLADFMAKFTPIPEMEEDMATYLKLLWNWH